MSIEQIGEQLVDCDQKCEGIINDKKRGVIPRCLYLEERAGKNKVIIIGINPGRCNNKRGKKERQYYMRAYRKNKLSYKTIKEYWGNIRKRKYYENLYDLAKKLGYTGAILWTELVKCELEKGKKDIPMQTMRKCINNWLTKEIKEFGPAPIIAVGNQVFQFCALRFPERTVIKVPHPTGSYGNFSHFIKKIELNHKKYIDEIKQKEGQAISFS